MLEFRDKKYSSSCVKAIYDFDPKEEDPDQMLGNEIAVVKGQLLQVLSRDEADWWYVESEAGKKGFVPSNHVQ